MSVVMNGLTTPDTSGSGNKIVQAPDGTLYAAFSAVTGSTSQVHAYKSLDGGKTWIDILFPLTPNFVQNTPSTVVDSKGKLHVAWYGTSPDSTSYAQIRYACYSNGAWSIPVNIGGYINYTQNYPSIAVDSSDYLHIVWCGCDSTNTAQQQIKYVNNTSGSWSAWTNIYVLTGYAQMNPSIAIDYADTIHVAWKGMDNTSTANNIKYIKCTNGVWSNFTHIATKNYAQYSPSIAVDSKGTPSIVWAGYDATYTSQTQINFATVVDSAWVTSYVAQISGNNQSYPVICIDENDKAHVAWHGTDSWSSTYTFIKYSNNISGSWTPWKNIATASVNLTNASALISQYSVNVMYSSTSTVEFCSNFTTVAAYTSGGVTLNTMGHSVVKDSNGTMYACYVSPVATYNQVFVVKSTDGSTWVDTGFPQIPSYTQYQPSMTIDRTNKLHVVWYGCDEVNTTLSQVFYANNIAGVWSNHVVIPGTQGYAQYDPSIAVDSHNVLHIIWSGADASGAKTIKYSNNQAGTWADATNAIVITGYHQVSPSVAVDSNDALHIVWQGQQSAYGSNYQVKYSNNTLGSWAPYVNVAAAAGKNHNSPCISLDSSDNAHVVWSGQDAATAQYKLKYSNNIGGTWVANINIYSTGATDQTLPTIDINTSGVARVTCIVTNAASGYKSPAYVDNASGSWGTVSVQYTGGISVSGYAPLIDTAYGPAIMYTNNTALELTTVAIRSALTLGLTSLSTVNNQCRKVVRTNSGELYTCMVASVGGTNNVFIYKSTDNGNTWVDTLFPIGTLVCNAPSIAVDTNGKIHLAFKGYDGVNGSTEQIRYSNNATGTWSTPVNVNTIVTASQNAPCIVIDSTNVVHIIWAGKTPTNTTYNRILYSSNLSGSWSAYTYVDSITGYDQNTPSVAIDKNDKIHVAWTGLDAGHTSYYYVKYSNNISGSWSPYVNVRTDGYTSTDSGPSIAVDSKCSAHIVWYNTDASYTLPQIKYSTNASSTWSAWVNIKAVAYSQLYPNICVDSNDKLHVLWQGYDATYTTQYSIRYSNNVNGSWCTVENKTGGNTTIPYTYVSAILYEDEIHMVYTASNYAVEFQLISDSNVVTGITSPAIDTVGQNKIVHSSDGSLYTCYCYGSPSQIFVSKSSDGGLTWVDTGFPQVPTYVQQYPSIACDKNGKLHVVWSGKNSTYTSYFGIFYSTNASGSWSTPLNVAPTLASYSSYSPILIIDKTNKMHLTWYSGDSSSGASYTQIKYASSVVGSGIWSSWVDVALIAGQSQTYPCIALDSNNNVHIAWEGTDASSATYSQIKYANNKGGTWSQWINIQPISGYHQHNPSMVIDSTDSVHIFYYGMDQVLIGTNSIKYTNNVQGVWSSWTNLVLTGYAQTNPVSAIDSAGNIHVIYTGPSGASTYNQVLYTNNIGGVWNTPVVRSTNFVAGVGLAGVCCYPRNLGILYAAGNGSTGQVKYYRETQPAPRAVAIRANPTHLYNQPSSITLSAVTQPALSSVLDLKASNSNGLNADGMYTVVDGTLHMTTPLQVVPMVDQGLTDTGRIFSVPIDLTLYKVINSIGVN